MSEPRTYYLCPDLSCNSVCFIFQDDQEVPPIHVNTLCQRGQAFTVPLVSLKPFLQWIDKSTSDGHHTFEELYRYRLLYNACLFNEWAKSDLYDVHKSRLHDDGTVPFGDPKWFIVMAELPTGQISNHYRRGDWDLFKIPERPVSAVYDGHTPAQVAERLGEFLRPTS